MILRGSSRKDSFHLRYLPKIAGALAVFGLFLFTLSPYLMNGFWADDGLNSIVRGWVEMQGISLMDFVLEMNQSWIRNSSRVFPLSLLVGYSGYYFFPTLEFFRLYQVLMTLLSVTVFGWLIADLSRNRAFAWMNSVLMLVFFQMRGYHDPIAGYGPLLQTSLLSLSGTLLFLRFSLREPRGTLFLTLSCATLAFGLLTYETALGTAFLGYFMLPSEWSWKSRLKKLAPLLGVLALYLGVALFLRSTNPSSYGGTTVSYNFQAIRQATDRQLSAAFPFSYFRHHLPELRFTDLTRQISRNPFDLTLLLAAALTFGWTLFRYDRQPRLDAQRRMILFGIGVALIPSLLIGLSVRYQAEVAWGLGYLPVFLSYFGVALIFALFLAFLLRHVRGTGKIIFVTMVSLLFGFGVALNRKINQNVSVAMDRGYKHPRQLIEDALHEGFFDGLRDGDWIVSEVHHQWLRAELFYAVRPYHLTIVSRDEIKAGVAFAPAPTAHVYSLNFSTEDPAVRWVTLRKIQTSKPNYDLLKHDACKSKAENLAIFLRASADVSVKASDDLLTKSLPFAAAHPPRSPDNWLRRFYFPSRQKERVTILRQDEGPRGCSFSFKMAAH